MRYFFTLDASVGLIGGACLGASLAGWWGAAIGGAIGYCVGLMEGEH